MQRIATSIGAMAIFIALCALSFGFADANLKTQAPNTYPMLTNGSWPDVKPVGIKTITTSADITIHYCYLLPADFEKVSKQSNKDMIPGDPDCVLGTGECIDMSSTVRLVFLPVQL